MNRNNEFIRKIILHENILWLIQIKEIRVYEKVIDFPIKI